jgi:Pyruvate/2-oxoacid:ferredoxin oxidoreductase delta subunit
MVDYEPSAIILQPGGAVDITYIIRSGRVKAGWNVHESEQILAYLSRGDCFGELGRLSSGGPDVTYTAVDFVSAARVRRNDIEAVLTWLEERDSEDGERDEEERSQTRVESCRTCVDPRCLLGCPVGAIHRTATRDLHIEDWCTGCGVCVKNCTHGSLSLEVSAGAGPDGPRKAVVKKPPAAQQPPV